MRISELVLVGALVLIMAVWSARRQRARQWAKHLGYVPLVILLSHLSLDGYRWQLLPAYVVTCVLLTIQILNEIRRANYATLSSRWRNIGRVAFIGIGILAVIFSGVLSAALPVFDLPDPTGSHPVGTTYLHFTDVSRPDEHSGVPGSYRQVPLRLWYPAKHSDDFVAASYMTAAEAEALSVFYGLPPFFFDHLMLVQSHSQLDAPPAAGPFPLIIFSPSGYESQATALCEELASHGFVTAAVNHAYWNAYSRDSAGKVVIADRHNSYYKQMWQEELSSGTNQIKDQITRSESLNEKRDLHRQLNLSMPTEVQDISEWARDVSFIIDQLEQPDGSTAALAGAANLKKIGVIGFSKGGATAGQACINDRRIGAGINMDGFMFGDIVEQNIPCPFMFVHSEPFLPDAYINDLFYESSLDVALLVKIRGSRHANFSDFSLFGPLLTYSEGFGPIDGQRLTSILNTHVLFFLNKILKEPSSTKLTDGLPDFQEVEIRMKPMNTVENDDRS